jgi:hypothetical protein
MIFFSIIPVFTWKDYEKAQNIRNTDCSIIVRKEYVDEDKMHYHRANLHRLFWNWFV